MTRPETVELVDIGVDWITCTFADESTGKAAAYHVTRLLDQQAWAGNTRKPWASSGYRGFSCGHVQTGERDDGLIVRLGSSVAQEHWRQFAELASNVSRVDVQATVRVGPETQPTLQKTFNRAKRVVRTKGNAPAVSFFHSTDGSATVYLGKRTSEMFGRIYDKGAESKLDHYSGCLRAEVEMKANRALQAIDGLMSCTNEAFFCWRLIVEYYSSRLVPVPFVEATSSDQRLAESSGTGPILLPLSRAASDCQKALAWARVSCARSFQRLVASGHGPQLLVNLGLLVSASGALEVVQLTSGQRKERNDA